MNSIINNFEKIKALINNSNIKYNIDIDITKKLVNKFNEF